MPALLGTLLHYRIPIRYETPCNNRVRRSLRVNESLIKSSQLIGRNLWSLFICGKWKIPFTVFQLFFFISHFPNRFSSGVNGVITFLFPFTFLFRPFEEEKWRLKNCSLQYTFSLVCFQTITSLGPRALYETYQSYHELWIFLPQQNCLCLSRISRFKLTIVVVGGR